MIFVLSTGRSGSTTIVNFLNNFQEISCVHEPSPVLIYEAWAYLNKCLSRQELIEILRKTRRPASFEARYAESNSLLSYMIDALQEAFPETAFLWLVRNGIDTVASWYTRGRYREDEIELSELSPVSADWARYRIRGDEVGVMSREDWRRLDCFARNCWCWAWTNTKIRTDLESIGARWMLVRLEDLADQAETISAFLQLKGTPRKIEIPFLNPTKWRRVIKADYWDNRQRASFERFCGSLMDELYPEWRSTFWPKGWAKARNELFSVLSPRYRLGRFLGKVGRKFPQSSQRILRRISDSCRN